MVSNIVKQKKDWHNLEFFMPINESINTGKDFIIRGVAINETTTRNGVTYVAEELEKAAPSFRNKPILLDHENSVKNIVGRVTENVTFNSGMKRIEFEAKIMDKQIQEMINDGRISDVSIGTRIQDLKQNDDEGTLTAIGMEGLEISLVAVPGDPGANLATAMYESYKVKEDNDLNIQKGGQNMTEQEQKTPEATEEEEVKETEEPEEAKEEVAEEKIQKTVINNTVDMSAVTEAIKALSDEVKSMKKEMAEEEKEVETKSDNPSAEEAPEDETKGEVVSDAEEPAEEAEESMHYEKADTGKGFQIWRDYTKDCKFKRLLR